ncbi:MAG: class I SAM-dependent methyltransferase, partial [Candidatus Omnitrophica bacterium]|nr:class I SAM-dependent methyltransferase [Candidatus Omnitrophota bacterium]
MSQWGEFILRKFSKDPSDSTSSSVNMDGWTVNNALNQLKSVYPDVKQLISGKRVLDFGCGLGYQSVAFYKEGAKEVLGIDTNTKSLHQARRLAKTHEVSEHVRFKEKIEEGDIGTFDVIISQNSMEHFPDPQQ